MNGVIEKRKKKYTRYKERLEGKYELYAFNINSVPWIFNLFVNNRDEFVEYCLDNNLPVSDWYPCVTPIFGDKGVFEEAFWHEKHIINFPLMISDTEIDAICDILLKYDA